MPTKYTSIRKIFIINIFVYALTLLFPEFIYEKFALHLFSSDNFHLYQLITYQFIHDTSPLHIIFNMMILIVFGSMVEKKFDSNKILFYYLLSGVVAGCLHNLTISENLRLSALLTGNELTLAGASGSVWSIMALFTLFFSNELLYLFFLPIGIKAKYLIPALFLVEVLSAIFTNDNVSHYAHIGGALSGVLIYFFNKKTN